MLCLPAGSGGSTTLSVTDRSQAGAVMLHGALWYIETPVNSLGPGGSFPIRPIDTHLAKFFRSFEQAMLAADLFLGRRLRIDEAIDRLRGEFLALLTARAHGGFVTLQVWTCSQSAGGHQKEQSLPFDVSRLVPFQRWGPCRGNLARFKRGGLSFWVDPTQPSLIKWGHRTGHTGGLQYAALRERGCDG